MGTTFIPVVFFIIYFFIKAFDMKEYEKKDREKDWWLTSIFFIFIEIYSYILQNFE